jgi:hypothetical protein
MPYHYIDGQGNKVELTAEENQAFLDALDIIQDEGIDAVPFESLIKTYPKILDAVEENELKLLHFASYTNKKNLNRCFSISELIVRHSKIAAGDYSNDETILNNMDDIQDLELKEMFCGLLGVDVDTAKTLKEIRDKEVRELAIKEIEEEEAAELAAKNGAYNNAKTFEEKCNIDLDRAAREYGQETKDTTEFLNNIGQRPAEITQANNGAQEESCCIVSALTEITYYNNPFDFLENKKTEINDKLNFNQIFFYNNLLEELSDKKNMLSKFLQSSYYAMWNQLDALLEYGYEGGLIEDALENLLLLSEGSRFEFLGHHPHKGDDDDFFPTSSNGGLISNSNNSNNDYIIVVIGSNPNVTDINM